MQTVYVFTEIRDWSHGCGQRGSGYSSQSDNEVDLSHFAPIIDTAVSFSDVQAISFSLLWIDTAPLHCV